MPTKEIKTEVIRLADNLAIPLPIAFCEGTTIKEGAELKIVRTKRGRFEIQVMDIEKEKIPCEICLNRPGKYTCSKCGKLACANCFWEWGNLCNKCIKR